MKYYDNKKEIAIIHHQYHVYIILLVRKFVGWMH